MFNPTWQTVTIDIDHDLEFTGDDADQFSDLIDLGFHAPGGILISVPTSALTSSALNVYTQRTGATDEVPVLFQYRQTSNNTPATWATTADTGNFTIHCPCYGVRYLRIRATTNQTTADKTFYCIGVA